MTDNFPTPRLLVSVRDAIEASAAIVGGCAIVDVKDPEAGPLGMAAIPRIAEIAGVVPGHRLSVALGELTEWPADRESPRLPASIAYLKAGPAGTGDIAKWTRRWTDLRSRFRENTDTNPQWMAVAYADADIAGAPAVLAIAEAVLELGAAGLLIDTFDKQSGRLTDLVSTAELQRIGEQLHRHGRLIALAGRLNSEILPQILDCGPDIVGVRSAVCLDENRRSKVTREGVAGFQRRLQRAVAGQF